MTKQATKPYDCDVCDGTPAMHAQHADSAQPVAEHTHRYPPSRDDCPRCVKVREVLKPQPVAEFAIAECLTCEPQPYRLYSQSSVKWHATGGHDVREARR